MITIKSRARSMRHHSMLAVSRRDNPLSITRLSALSHPHWHIAVKSYHIVKPPRHNTNMRHTCCTMSSSAADETRRYIRQSSMRPSLAKRDIDDPTMCPCAFEPTAVAIFRWWRPYAVPCNAVGRCYYVAVGRRRRRTSSMSHQYI